MDINILPDEILELIISHSDNRSALNFSLTCKKFRDIIRDCIIRKKFYNKDLSHCFICTHCSITTLPIYYVVFTLDNNTVTNMVCSKTCRKKCLDIKTPVYAICFGRK